MPRNLEARNFLSLLQRSPSPLLPFPLPRSPSVQSALCPSSQSPRSHLPSSTLLLHSIFAFFVLRHTPSSPRHPSYTFSSPVSSRPLDLYLSSLFLSLSLSVSLRCSASAFHRLPLSLPVETHALTHQPIRPCDARLYRGCTTWPLANYLSSCSCASKRREGLRPPREGFFFDHPGANIDKVNVAVSGHER